MTYNRSFCFSSWTLSGTMRQLSRRESFILADGRRKKAPPSGELAKP